KAIVASTATATPQVATDIVSRLGLRDAVRVTTGFDRPNLSFAVVPCRGPAEKRARLVAALGEPGARPAIVYAGTRADTERLAGELHGALGVTVLAYHAGLRRDERAETQRRFMAGDVEVVVATNAFGMGVDKADVRTVAHASVPGSVEAYYQEAGRAGRDGAPARALLLAEARDKGLHVFFIERAEVDDAAVARVADLLAATAGTLPLGDAGGTFDVAVDQLGDDPERVRAIIGHLARAGVVTPAPAPLDRVRGRLAAPFDARARAACRASAGDAQRARWRQYRSVWAFVEGDTCRRATILRHFGDPKPPAPSGACCDVCAPEIVAAAPAASGGLRSLSAAAPAELDAAIVEVVATADPPVGRTRVVEILRGGRSQALRRHSYDGLALHGSFAGLPAEEVLGRVDALLSEGRLRSTGGAYPTLRAGAGALAA
ncbi:MAG: ATP-dependent helicase RecQ, partial [Solirubrobacteraceae bacterium]|nr:ATP-dependent helicase RecQ [Solirubrobacteraceae bacterium]